MRIGRHIVWLLLVSAAVSPVPVRWSGALVEARAPRQTTPQSRPVFRGRVDLIPIDVSVLDRHGNPVLDLKQEDFTILEDKTPQPIKTFAVTRLAPEPPPPDQPTMLLRTAPTATAVSSVAAPRKGRTFLIVFCWGRIEEPTGVFEATIEFIRHKLLPQDYVGLLAWDRATDLTTDHEAVARIVERYRAANPKVITDIEYFEFWHPGEDLPAWIQAEIDAVFNPSGARKRGDLQIRSATQMLFGTEEFLNENRGKGSPPWNDWVAHWGLSDNRLQRLRRDSRGRILPTVPLHFEHDMPKIYAAVEYLKLVDGEKHMILCTPGPYGGPAGFGGPDIGLVGREVEADYRFASRTGDARIAVDIIYTAGVPAFKGFPKNLGFSAAQNPEFIHFMGASETVAEQTGGQFLGTYPAAASYTRIDQATRFGYMLGYSPSNPALDNSLRKIVVKVNRPDVTVSYRRAYHAQAEVSALELKETVAALRKAGAGNYDREINDLDVSADASPISLGLPSMRVDVKIGLAKLQLSPAADNHRIGGLRVAIYCGDAKENVVGNLQQSIDLDLDADAYSRADRDGLRYSFRVPTTGVTKYVKVVVYDFATDRTGSVMLTMK